jgi:hypothetical protein
VLGNNLMLQNGSRLAKMATDIVHFGNAEMAADIQTISNPHLATYLVVLGGH